MFNLNSVFQVKLIYFFRQHLIYVTFVLFCLGIPKNQTMVIKKPKLKKKNANKTKPWQCISAPLVSEAH